MKRYEKYKFSKNLLTNEIPSHWNMIRNRTFLQPKNILVGRDASSYALLSLTTNGIIKRDIEGGKGKFPKDFDTYQVIEPNDIVFCLFDVDETPRTVGVSSLKGMLTGAYDAFSIRNSVDAHFINYYYTAVDDIKALRPYYTGLRKVVRRDKFMSISIPIPPIAEQKRIVAFLDKRITLIEDCKCKRERELQTLNELRQAEIASVVTRGLNPDVPMKDSGIPWIGQIPAHWRVKSLRAYLRLVSEKNHPYAPLLSVTRELGVIVRDIESKEENHNFIPEDLSGYKYVKTGQFVINKMKAWQGSYGVSPYDGIVSPAYYVCELDFPNKGYFSIAIRSKTYIDFFARLSKGIRVGQWDLEPIALKSIPFLEPPIEEQNAIVEYIESKTRNIDTMIEALKAEIDRLTEYKQRLISDVVTGQVNVQNEKV